MLAEAGESDRLQKARIFRFFCRSSFFFIAIRLYCGGGSAPHFAANAVLKRMSLGVKIHAKIDPMKPNFINLYCKLDREKTGASRPRGGRARDFVNFRENIHASRTCGASARV
jgi:hypothetical protein